MLARYIRQCAPSTLYMICIRRRIALSRYTSTKVYNSYSPSARQDLCRESQEHYYHKHWDERANEMSTTLSTNLHIAMPSSHSPTSAPRASRFTEGSPLTGAEVLSADASSAVFLTSILSQMDEHERRRSRSHRNSASSTSSFNSTSSSHSSSGSGSISRSSQIFGINTSTKENRRSIAFSMETVRRSVDEMRSSSNVEAKGGFKGRLRALTGGSQPSRRDSVKAYIGT